MGTRADFYIGIDENMEWIGSVSHDGYPYWEAIDSKELSECVAAHGIFDASSENDYRELVARMFDNRPDVSKLPEDGWPWGWKDSTITDWAYTFHDNQVWATADRRTIWRHAQCFREGVIDPKYSDVRLPATFPDMSTRPQQGGDSGFMLFRTL